MPADRFYVVEENDDDDNIVDVQHFCSREHAEQAAYAAGDVDLVRLRAVDRDGHPLAYEARESSSYDALGALEDDTFCYYCGAMLHYGRETLRECMAFLAGVQSDIETFDESEVHGYEIEPVDVRAQYVDGEGWTFHSGGASYDQDHRGAWSAASILPDDARETIAYLLLSAACDAQAEAIELAEAEA